MTGIVHPATPTGWGQDPFTRYLDTCRANQLATFANKRSAVIDLTTIDGMFRKLIDGAVNPKPFLPMGFLGRAHSAFLAAAGAVMAGQVYEAQAQLRVCLEQGAYAHYIGDDQARWERWMNRHDSPAAKQAVRDEFTHGNICRHIKAAAPELGGIYSELYDRVIDYGAHPNERGSSLSSMMEETEDGGRRFSTICLHGDGLQMDVGLKTTAQTGLWVLGIAQELYPLRVQATGVKYELEVILKRF